MLSLPRAHENQQSCGDFKGYMSRIDPININTVPHDSLRETQGKLTLFEGRTRMQAKGSPTAAHSTPKVTLN